LFSTQDVTLTLSSQLLGGLSMTVNFASTDRLKVTNVWHTKLIYFLHMDHQHFAQKIVHSYTLCSKVLCWKDATISLTYGRHENAYFDHIFTFAVISRVNIFFDIWHFSRQVRSKYLFNFTSKWRVPHKPAGGRGENVMWMLWHDDVDKLTEHQSVECRSNKMLRLANMFFFQDWFTLYGNIIIRDI